MPFFDRNGKAIDVLEWAKLIEDDNYRLVARNWVTEGVVEIVTWWDGFDPLLWAASKLTDETTLTKPRIFRIGHVKWENGNFVSAKTVDKASSEDGAKYIHEFTVHFMKSEQSLKKP